MEATVGHDHGHPAAAAAINGDLEVKLATERNNGTAAAAIPAVEEQGQAEERTDGGWTRGRLVRRLHPAPVARACWRWLKHPAHVALVAWALCVAAAGSMLGLLLTGTLDSAIPKRSIRYRWVEITNQVLNALFTLMSIYQHPSLFHHAAMLLRWRPRDAEELREAYCRKGARRGGEERAHMSVVVALLHTACFAQYATCALYWGYSRKARPEGVETFLVVLGTAAPVIAGLYTYFSPLGKKHGGDPSGVLQDPKPDDRSSAEVLAGSVGTVEWAGGMLDVGEDPTAWWLSCFCIFCVFGWNMERLGLGNARVHTVMFALLCFAPVWVLNVVATNIKNEVVADAVGAAGVVLCTLGLLYGGFWRARMRQKFRLPAGGDGTFSPWLVDYLRWLFCWSCALAQEVRTADVLLDVEAGSVVHRRGDSAPRGGRVVVDVIALQLQPLPRENGVKSPRQGGSSRVEAACYPVRMENYSASRGDESPLLWEEQRSITSSSPAEMTAPVPLSMPQGQRGRGQ
nr:unnamed protein product [Digitaria exilis]